MTNFYDANVVEQTAINLFYGWGYNFYRKENQLRADDLMIRSKVSWLLGLARTDIKNAESIYRNENILPLSREHPRPDPEVVKKAKTLENLANLISQVESKIRTLPVPENDRMTQRHRQEKDTLEKLLSFDKTVVGSSELLRQAVNDKSIDEIINNLTYIQSGLLSIKNTLEARQSVLM